MKITKEWLQEQEACYSGIKWFLSQEKTDSLEVLKDLIAESKLDDANWLIVRVMDRKQQLAYAIFAAEQVLPIFEKKYSEDDRPRKAIEAAKAVMEDDTEENRAAAANAAEAAGAAAADPAYAYAAADAAADAAEAAARAAAADSAAWAAYYAAAAASAAREAMQLKILKFGISLLREEFKS